MGILDEAIREHLELKRKRGAAQDELRQLEDEAFGPAKRPEAEAAQPEAEGSPAAEAEAPFGEPSPAAADLPTSEREAIAQQPTEVFDVASELALDEGDETVSEGPVESDAEAEAEPAAEAPVEAETPEPPAPETEAAASTPEAPVDEAEAEAPAEPEAEQVAPEAVEPEPATPGPEAEAEAPPTEIFDERSLAEELDQALEGPLETEERRPAFFEETDEFQAPSLPSRPAPKPEPEPEDAGPADSGEDVLEGTPDFLEEAPEHDRLWFEQKPPKDFDFND